MGLLHWEALQRLNTLNQYMYALLRDLIQTSCETTLWVGDGAVTWIPALEVTETDTDITLRAEIPNGLANTLSIEVTQETIILRGEREKSVELRNYLDFEFYPGQFQSLVPLPAPIQPQTASAELQGCLLTLTLQKSWQPRQTVYVELHTTSQPMSNAQPVHELIPELS